MSTKNFPSVLVTGGAGLIGEAIVKQLVLKGIKVYSLDVVECKHSSMHLNCDLADLDQLEYIKKFMENIKAPFAVIHCAGIDFKTTASLDSEINFLDIESPDNFLKVVNTNINMTYNLIFLSLPLMRRFQNGLFVFLGSMYGSLAPNKELYYDKDLSKYFMRKPFSYSISKSTFPMFAKLIASRYASDGIKAVNLELHAIIDTLTADPRFLANFSTLSPTRLTCRKEEVVEFVSQLVDSNFTYLNGCSISFDGGWSSI